MKAPFALDATVKVFAGDNRVRELDELGVPDFDTVFHIPAGIVVVAVDEIAAHEAQIRILAAPEIVVEVAVFTLNKILSLSRNLAVKFVELLKKGTRSIVGLCEAARIPIVRDPRFVAIYREWLIG